jgi:hypothetical protein
MPNNPIAHYLLSLPERLVRSAGALAGGLARELSDVVIPKALRRTYLYQNLVEGTLRFLIEQVGEVEGTYPTEGELTRNFLLRRGAGNGIEFIGILTFHASPVWVMAALADISGAGRQLIQEITTTLQQEGLLDKDTHFETVEQMLDGLEKTAGHAAQAINMPPLDVAGLRAEWIAMRDKLKSIPAPSLPSADAVWNSWKELKREAEAQKRSVFELSSLMAMSSIRWVGLSASLAAQRTGQLFAAALLDHYSETLLEIRKAGYLGYWAQEFRPYLKAAALQFSPGRGSLTQRLLRRTARQS